MLSRKQVNAGIATVVFGLAGLAALFIITTDDERLAPTASMAYGTSEIAPEDRASLEIVPPALDEKDFKKRLQDSIRASIAGRLQSVGAGDNNELKVVFAVASESLVLSDVQDDVAKVLRCARSK